jgi:hypothetical protein
MSPQQKVAEAALKSMPVVSAKPIAKPKKKASRIAGARHRVVLQKGTEGSKDHKKLAMTVSPMRNGGYALRSRLQPFGGKAQTAFETFQGEKAFEQGKARCQELQKKAVLGGWVEKKKTVNLEDLLA